MKKEVALSSIAVLALILAASGMVYWVWLNNTRLEPQPLQDHTVPTSSQQVVGNTSNNLPQNCEYVSSNKNTKLNLCNNMDRGSDIPGLPNPFTLQGSTIVFENQFNYEILDDLNNVIASGQAYANSPDTGLPGPFTIKDFFDVLPATASGRIELIEYSAKDGSRIVLLSVPTRFYSETFKFLDLSFPNNQKDPQMLDCSQVYSVSRQQAFDGKNIGVVVHELLLGPSADEQAQGYFTTLPAKVNDPKISFIADTVYLDFDDSLEQDVAGSCRVQAIRAQIEQTIKQNFPQYQVEISVNGRTQDILQP